MSVARVDRRPTRYGGLADSELAAAIAEWFDRHGERCDAWNRTATGRELKSKLTSLGRFKYKPHGNPAWGYAVMIERRAAARAS